MTQTAATALFASASVPGDDPQAADRLLTALGPGPFARILLFATPSADLPAIAARLTHALAEAAGLPPDPRLVIGCTTAGEITGAGYGEGQIVAVGLPATHFATEALLIPDLMQLSAQDLIGQVIRARTALAARHPGWDGEFAFLMVDGLSLREDELTAALAPGLGSLPLFGGSAGDGTAFGETRILWQGRARSNAAILLLVRSACRVRVFSLDHLTPSDCKMVVTEADPARRIVRRLNAEPAAREYARLLGKDPAQLTTFTFAAHPLVVRVGGRHHVRAIQRVDANGDLVFFSAIDEGLVLTLAEAQDMVTHLDSALTALSDPGPPAAILACDCILRRMEAMERQSHTALSQVLARHRVVGFSTYGEQWNSMHVNQTMTGVALYPPGAPPMTGP
ncbi:MAG: FIST C-terminal domain-containing protein [Cypionkella sp.]|nr:FIST C-terminal domain-containing protein [Cypionkella sp.]